MIENKWMSNNKELGGEGKTKRGNREEEREEDELLGEKVSVTFIFIQLVAQRKINDYDL